ncbi:MAG: uroporphyrinogen decarboxylase family protein [candidate division Zixibacteria bacterium]
MANYSPRERIELILSGEKPDRFAASFWRHFYHKESSADGTAEAMLDFQNHFGWDFMKINPRADYHAEDWGLELDWSTAELTKHTKVKFPISKPDDWDNIEPLKPSAPVLAEHLQVVNLIRKGAGKELPILMTMFTPLAIAGRMVEDDKLLAESIRTHPEKVHNALKAITATFKKYVEELRNAGADGLFYATTQWASSNLISWEEYQQFGIPYDLEVINASGDDALNLFHVCSSNNFLKQLSELDYKSQLYNWDSEDPTNSPIEKALDILPGKTLVGGIDHKGWLLHSSAHEIVMQMQSLKQKFDSSRIIIGPGCSIDPATPKENLQAIKDNL